MKFIIILLLLLTVVTIASADVEMIGMKGLGGDEYVVWHPGGTVSLYLVVSGKLVKAKSLNLAQYPLAVVVNPIGNEEKKDERKRSR